MLNFHIVYLCNFDYYILFGNLFCASFGNSQHGQTQCKDFCLYLVMWWPKERGISKFCAILDLDSLQFFLEVFL